MFSRHSTIKLFIFTPTVKAEARRKRFERKMPRNPRSVDLKVWYQISAKLHKAFKSNLLARSLRSDQQIGVARTMWPMVLQLLLLLPLLIMMMMTTMMMC
jgi:hypothetical protein